jgi:hypothetical protein
LRSVWSALHKPGSINGQDQNSVRLELRFHPRTLECRGESSNMGILRRARQREWEQIHQIHAQRRRQLWKYLCSDRDFVLETARLRYNLTLHYRNDPKILQSFFKGGYFTIPSEFETELKRISDIADVNFRTLLERYLRYTIRFQVYFVLPPATPRRVKRVCPFRIRMLRSGNSMFRARIKGGRLRPVGPYDPDNEPASEAFAIESISVPDALKKMINPPPPGLNSKRNRPVVPSANFLLIEDDNGTSMLCDLLRLSYSPETITFVQVNGGETPYLFCVIGENVSIDSVWRQAGVAVKQMQVQLYKRERAGRPVKLTTLKKGMNSLLRSSQFAPLKSKVEPDRVGWLSAVKQKLQM